MKKTKSSTEQTKLAQNTMSYSLAQSKLSQTNQFPIQNHFSTKTKIPSFNLKPEKTTQPSQLKKGI